MARSRTIACIGEALIIDEPQGTRAGGLAVDAALAAKRFGHRGIPIARVGQDRAAESILEFLQEHALESAHLQTDPDRATGRLILRKLAGREELRLDPSAAFDHLQWDYDLHDVAQIADGVVFGQLANRSTQTRSVIEQVLEASTGAVRCFDLSLRAPRQTIDRSELSSIFAVTEIALLDDFAMRALMPSALPRGSSDVNADADRQAADASSALSDAWRGAARSLRRQANLALAVRVQPGQPVELHDDAAQERSLRTFDPKRRAACSIALMHGLIAGWESPQIIALLDRVLDPAQKCDASMADAWLDGAK